MGRVWVPATPANATPWLLAGRGLCLSAGDKAALLPKQ